MSSESPCARIPSAWAGSTAKIVPANASAVKSEIFFNTEPPIELFQIDCSQHVLTCACSAPIEPDFLRLWNWITCDRRQNWKCPQWENCCSVKGIGAKTFHTLLHVESVVSDT